MWPPQLKAYKQRLKLVTTLRLLQVLIPQVDQICAEQYEELA